MDNRNLASRCFLYEGSGFSENMITQCTTVDEAKDIAQQNLEDEILAFLK